ncbi:MAG: hypothetical protein Q9167_001904 [Letrouitia subvulpina]
MADVDLSRLHTYDLELGATEAVQKHYSRHVVAQKPVSQRKLDFEHARFALPSWDQDRVNEKLGRDG